MSQSFTPAEYAVMAHLMAKGRSTIPALAADLLLRLGETEGALSSLQGRGLIQKEGDAYSAGLGAMEMPAIQVQKGATGRMPVRPSAAPAAPALASHALPAASTPDVALVFQKARERAQREGYRGAI